MWRMTSTDGKNWVQQDGTAWTASADLQDLINGDPLPPVEIAAMTGAIYTPLPGLDPVAIYLHARMRLGDPARVTGTPPPIPDASGVDSRPGLVY